MPLTPDYGDLIAVQGVGWLSDHIRAATGGGPASHIAIITAVEPFVQVTQALNRVVVTALEEVLDGAAHVWLLKSPLSADDRNVASRNAIKHTGDDYAYWNILCQLADSESGSRWFTEHWAETRDNICSQLATLVEPSLGLIPKDATPNDIWGYWLLQKWPMEQLK